MKSGTLIWITGLAGSGKTTLAERVVARLRSSERGVVLLDGDAVREVMGEEKAVDLPGRLRNALRIARLCRLLTQQGITVVCATISLFHDVHEFNRRSNSRYLEVFLECSMDELRRRDKKGLYSGALAGSVQNVVGVDQPFERPKNSDLILNNSGEDHKAANLEAILNAFQHMGTQH